MKAFIAKTRTVSSRAFRRSGCSFVRCTQGVSALEYAILVGIIAVAIALALTTFSETITDAIDAIGVQVTGLGIASS